MPHDTLVDFPADLFLIRVGVTHLFTIANNNGTADRLAQAAVLHNASSVAVVTNSARLLRCQPTQSPRPSTTT